MFGLSIEHWIILAIILFIFGPKRIPILTHSFKKAIQNFKDGKEGVQEAEFKRVKEEKKD